MIIEIPSPDEFTKSGVNLLNLAWSIGMSIVSQLESAAHPDWDLVDDVADDYWRESQPALGNALALVQQAQEMALKGKIAAVSPYLLIAGEPRDWPRRCEQEDTPFTVFRTINAADLIKIHNTVCPSPSRLGKDFEDFFDVVRRQRNNIIHVGGTGRQVDVAELILNVLRTNEHLYPEERWVERRLTHLADDPILSWFGEEAYGSVVKEFFTAARLLKPAEAKKFFGLTKARRYICPQCNDAVLGLVDEPLPLAQLLPNTPSATTISCFVCGDQTTVVRKVCAQKGCKSNVICAEAKWGPICLVCGSHQDQPVRGRRLSPHR